MEDKLKNTQLDSPVVEVSKNVNTSMENDLVSAAEAYRKKIRNYVDHNDFELLEKQYKRDDCVNCWVRTHCVNNGQLVENYSNYNVKVNEFNWRPVKDAEKNNVTLKHKSGEIFVLLELPKVFAAVLDDEDRRREKEKQDKLHYRDAELARNLGINIEHKGVTPFR